MFPISIDGCALSGLHSLRSSNRRDFLRTLIGAAAGLSLSQQVFAETVSGPIAANRLNDNFALITGAGGNVLAVSGPDGLLMVNGGLAERSADLMKFIADEFKGKPVRTLFNTDWHLEHTGSNEPVRKAGAKVMAHENTKLWIGADFYSDWEKKSYKPRPAIAQPNETFYTSGTTMFGAEKVEYGYAPQAHTDGDIYVFFPGPNILYAGDLLSVGKYPVLDYVTGGWLGGLQQASQALLKVVNEQTKIIPGSGPLQSRADLQAQSDMCTAMRERLTKLMRQGMGPKDIIAAEVTKEFDAKWGNPDLFIATAYRGMWLHVRELGGIV